MKVFRILFFVSSLFLILTPSEAHALNPSNLLPHHTYYLVADVRPTTSWYRVSYRTHESPRLVIATGRTDAEISDSIRSWMDPMKGGPNLQELSSSDAPRGKLDPEKKPEARMLDLITSQVKGVHPDAEGIEVFPLGVFGTAKLIQVIPLAETPRGGPSMKFWTKLSDGREVEIISAQRLTLTFRYNSKYKIIGDQVTSEFQRGPSWTFPLTHRFVGYVPKEDGTNLLGNLTARATKPALSPVERFAMSPPESQIKDHFSLADRLTGLPATLRTEILELLTQSMSSIKTQAENPMSHDLVAEAIGTGGRVPDSDSTKKPKALQLPSPKCFKQSLYLDAELSFNHEIERFADRPTGSSDSPEGSPSRHTSHFKDDLTFGPFDLFEEYFRPDTEGKSTKQKKTFLLGHPKFGRKVPFDFSLSGSFQKGEFTLLLETEESILNTDGTQPGKTLSPALVFHLKTAPIEINPTHQLPVIQDETLEILEVGKTGCSPKEFGFCNLLISLSGFPAPEGIKTPEIRFSNYFRVVESNYSCPELTTSPEDTSPPESPLAFRPSKMAKAH